MMVVLLQVLLVIWLSFPFFIYGTINRWHYSIGTRFTMLGSLSRFFYFPYRLLHRALHIPSYFLPSESTILATSFLILFILIWFESGGGSPIAFVVVCVIAYVIGRYVKLLSVVYSIIVLTVLVLSIVYTSIIYASANRSPFELFYGFIAYTAILGIAFLIIWGITLAIRRGTKEKALAIAFLLSLGLTMFHPLLIILAFYMIITGLLLSRTSILEINWSRKYFFFSIMLMGLWHSIYYSLYLIGTDWFAKWGICATVGIPVGFMIGKLLYGSVRLVPGEILYSTTPEEDNYVRTMEGLLLGFSLGFLAGYAITLYYGVKVFHIPVSELWNLVGAAGWKAKLLMILGPLIGGASGFIFGCRTIEMIGEYARALVRYQYGIESNESSIRQSYPGRIWYIFYFTFVSAFSLASLITLILLTWLFEISRQDIIHLLGWKTIVLILLCPAIGLIVGTIGSRIGRRIVNRGEMHVGRLQRE